MFFRKSSENINPANVAKKSIKSMDAVVTGVILGGIVASIYGVKKLKEKNDKQNQDEHINLVEETKNFPRRTFWSRVFGKN